MSACARGSRAEEGLGVQCVFFLIFLAVHSLACSYASIHKQPRLIPGTETCDGIGQRCRRTARPVFVKKVCKLCVLCTCASLTQDYSLFTLYVCMYVCICWRNERVSVGDNMRACRIRPFYTWKFTVG